MSVDVVHIGRVRMHVSQLSVFVGMSMGFTGRLGVIVLVPMMFIVNMGVRVRRRLVNVFVLVAFREMQPDAQAHEPSSGVGLSKI